MSTLQTGDLLQKRGEDLYDTSGDKLGSIQEIYLDADTGAPEGALVNTGMFGTKSSFVPLRGATDDGSLRVPYDKSQVKDAPKINPDRELSQTQEAELYRHYGLDYSESRSDSGLPEGGPGAWTRRPSPTRSRSPRPSARRRSTSTTGAAARARPPRPASSARAQDLPPSPGPARWRPVSSRLTCDR